jgi:nitroreductase
MNEVVESLMNHRSVRKYQAKPVEPEVLDLILNAGIRAATAGNLQQYALIVVDEENQKEALGLAHAPLVIVAMVDLYRLKRWFDISDTAPICNNRANNLFIGFWDAIIALHNIVIAAESLGLGTCYMGGILSVDIQEIFDAPEYIFPAGMVSMGYPEELPDLSIRLPLEAVLHRNTYQIPSDDDIRGWYQEREGVWETVSDKLKDRLSQQGIYSIPQAIAVQKYSAAVAEEQSKGLLDNLRKSRFILREGPDQVMKA